jgi:hypothetical protein
MASTAPAAAAAARRFVLRVTTATLSLAAFVAASLPHRTYPAFVPPGASPYDLAASHHPGKKQQYHQQQQHAFSTFGGSRRTPTPSRRGAVVAAGSGDDDRSSRDPPTPPAASFPPITVDSTTRTAWPDLRPAQWKQIEALANLLVEVNTKINVISRKDIQVLHALR